MAAKQGPNLTNLTLPACFLLALQLGTKFVSSSPPSILSQPEQVHLSLGDSLDRMTAMWSTPYPLDAPPQVVYGLNASSLGQRQLGSTNVWVYEGVTGITHTAVMIDLRPNTTYYYKVGGVQGWSHLFHFRTLSAADHFPLRICIFGDTGYHQGFALPYVQELASRDAIDLIIHLGDLAYDLHSDKGARGDAFLRQIEPIAAYVPFLTVAGNHEEDGANYTNYVNRFNMPNDPFGDSQVYSIDVGPLHLVATSTEYYGFFLYYGQQQVHSQLAWLRDDLQRANTNRANVPWILSYQHRPFYCSNLNSYECRMFEMTLPRVGFTRMPGLEPTFIDGGVDLGFWGHEHSYERFHPIANRRVYNDSDSGNPYHNADAPIYIISGSGGCHSGHAWFGDPAPGSVVRNNDYGFGVLEVVNRTHLHWQQFSVEAGVESTKVVDELWVSKDEGHVPSPAGKKFVPFPEDGMERCERDENGREICRREEVLRHSALDRLRRGSRP